MINLVDKYGYITEEIDRQGYSLFKVDNVWLTDDEQEVQNIIDTFDPLPNARIDAIQRINNQAQSKMQYIEDEYPEFEKRTWPTQKAEVEAWLIDSTSLTPTLDAIANARGIGRVTLLNKTYAKVVEYNTTAATLAGKRQKLEDEILNSTDLDFICTVNFEV